MNLDTILVDNLISSASFRCEKFLKIALGTMLFSCMVKMCVEQIISQIVRSNHQSVPSVLEFFKNFTEKHLFRSLFLANPEGLQLHLKESPTRVLSCEICDIFKNA